MRDRVSKDSLFSSADFAVASAFPLEGVPAVHPTLCDPRVGFLIPPSARPRLHALWYFFEHLLGLAGRVGADNADNSAPQALPSLIFLQLKLAWWRDALADIAQPDWSPPLGEPLLQAIATYWMPAYREAAARDWVALIDEVEILLCGDLLAQRLSAAESLGLHLFALSRIGGDCAGMQPAIDGASDNPSAGASQNATKIFVECAIPPNLAAGRVWGLLRSGLTIAALAPDMSIMLLTEALEKKLHGQRQTGLERGLYMLDLWAATAARAVQSCGKRQLGRESLILARVGLFGR